jgi:glutamate-1-semialdehyde 2,1-aminomutase
MSPADNLLRRAQAVIPGGVNSPVRAFKSVDLDPLFISHANGQYLYSTEDKKFIDYVGSWGPMILGHNSSIVRDAVAKALDSGVSFGAPTKAEVEFAELLCEVVPGMQMVRMVNSGTEATMTAIRLARGYTGKKYIIKFNGCYHGHADSLLVKAGSGVATHGISGSLGVPEEIAALTVSIEFNDQSLLEKTLNALEGQVAAVIIEPVPGNMGLVLPRDGYLQAVQKLCGEHQCLLILDEVMSGFRVALGGATSKFGLQPDLITLGKVIGGGLPVGAVGGKREIMQFLSPLGPVYQAGTLSGNPLSMAAGLAAIRYLIEHNPYPELERKAKFLSNELSACAKDCRVPFVSSSIGSMFGFFFSERPVHNYAEACQNNQTHFKKFFKLMLEGGINLAPSAFEGFLSISHQDSDLERTIEVASSSFAVLSKE